MSLSGVHRAGISPTPRLHPIASTHHIIDLTEEDEDQGEDWRHNRRDDSSMVVVTLLSEEDEEEGQGEGEGEDLPWPLDTSSPPRHPDSSSSDGAHIGVEEDQDRDVEGGVQVEMCS